MIMWQATPAGMMHDNVLLLASTAGMMHDNVAS